MESILRTGLIATAFSLMSGLAAAEAEWQWSVPDGGGRAFLWVPPAAARIRAVVIAQHNMLEEGVLEHPEFREELARLGIAEMWVVPKISSGPDIEDGSGERMLALLSELAVKSGYAELASAPVAPFGHSACATFPWNFAARFPERTLAVLSVHGDAPQTDLTGNGRKRMDWDGGRIDGIPGLFTMGEYEWMEERIRPGLDFRKRNPRSCIAMLAEPAQGHFDACEELVDFLALFLRKSVHARLSESGELRPVDSSKGWLVQKWKLREGRAIPSAPVAEYQGDPAGAFWAFDEETARAIGCFHTERIGRKPQLLGFIENGGVVPQVDRHEQVNLSCQPEDDGISFKLKTGFLSEVESGSANLARWTGLSVGMSLGHASTPTEIRRITGPFAVTGPGRFEIRLNRAWHTPDKRKNQLWFAARNPGDGEYAGAVQQALMTIRPNESGKPQSITFDPPQELKAGVSLIPLKGTASSGLPVRYFVREGPARIEGNLLRVGPIPKKAKFPLKITVVAWQWGNREWNTAPVVERELSLDR